MGESGTVTVCPYCEGKGYVSLVIEHPPDDEPREGLSRTTWVRRPCPLCDGKGQILGMKPSTHKLCRYFGRVPTFRQSLALQPVGP
jgi:RecJ-like exonuclease